MTITQFAIACAINFVIGFVAGRLVTVVGQRKARPPVAGFDTSSSHAEPTPHAESSVDNARVSTARIPPRRHRFLG